jgi:hypothetical protein
VNVLQEVSAGSRWSGVVSSYWGKRGSGVGLGPAQGSLSNYRLKLTVRGRSPAAGDAGRWAHRSPRLDA